MSENAIANAKAWLETIREMVAQLTDAEDRSRDDLRDEARDRIYQAPLSVMVRDGWRPPGTVSDGPEEFEILLTTGGPALRIRGELRGDSEAHAPVLQWQDWGTPWTTLPLTDEEYDALRAFCSVFYFEEG